MSDSLKKQSTFSNPDTARSGRPRSSSRPKPVTEARASAQRQKVERQRSQRLEQAGREDQQPEPPTCLPKKGTQQGTSTDQAMHAYIQDQVGGNRSPKTIEWHQTALGLFITHWSESLRPVRAHFR
jgi:hypothetical protein